MCSAPAFLSDILRATPTRAGAALSLAISVVLLAVYYGLFLHYSPRTHAGEKPASNGAKAGRLRSAAEFVAGLD